MFRRRDGACWACGAGAARVTTAEKVSNIRPL